jgi:hypothetical protein
LGGREPEPGALAAAVAAAPLGVVCVWLCATCLAAAAGGCAACFLMRMGGALTRVLCVLWCGVWWLGWLGRRRVCLGLGSECC